MTTKTVSATVPANVKAEAAVVAAAHGISRAALLRELLARVDARDPVTLESWLHEKAGMPMTRVSGAALNMCPFATVRDWPRRASNPRWAAWSRPSTSCTRSR